MSFQIVWCLDQRIVSVQMSHIVTKEEAFQLGREIEQYVKAGTPPVHVVVDALELKQYPMNIGLLRDASRYLFSSKCGWAIMVGHNNSLTRFLASAVTQMAHVNFRIAADWDEALATLKKVDMTLTDPPAHPE